MIEIFNVRVLATKTLDIFKLIDQRGGPSSLRWTLFINFSFFFLNNKNRNFRNEIFLPHSNYRLFGEKIDLVRSTDRGIQQKQDFYSGHVWWTILVSAGGNGILLNKLLRNESKEEYSRHFPLRAPWHASSVTCEVHGPW